MPDEMKEPVGRCILKLSVAALIAIVAKHESYLLTFAFWVSLYALFAAVFAVLRGERLSRESINHWDEAMWLGATALFLQFASRVI